MRVVYFCLFIAYFPPMKKLNWKNNYCILIKPILGLSKPASVFTSTSIFEYAFNGHYQLLGKIQILFVFCDLHEKTHLRNDFICQQNGPHWQATSSPISSLAIADPDTSCPLKRVATSPCTTILDLFLSPGPGN